MEEMSRNDPVLFEALFKRYYQLLTAKSFEICGNWQMAEDAVQDFFADVWSKKSWLSVTTNFISYAAKGVQYKTISLLRKSGKQNSNLPAEELMPAADTGREAEYCQEQLQREQQLIEALNALPVQRKEAFMLAHYYNKSYAEISRQMGVSVNTVKTHLRLAMNQLREILLVFFILFIFL